MNRWYITAPVDFDVDVRRALRATAAYPISRGNALQRVLFRANRLYITQALAAQDEHKYPTTITRSGSLVISYSATHTNTWAQAVVKSLTMSREGVTLYADWEIWVGVIT